MVPELVIVGLGWPGLAVVDLHWVGPMNNSSWPSLAVVSLRGPGLAFVGCHGPGLTWSGCPWPVLTCVMLALVIDSSLAFVQCLGPGLAVVGMHWPTLAVIDNTHSISVGISLLIEYIKNKKKHTWGSRRVTSQAPH